MLAYLCYRLDNMLAVVVNADVIDRFVGFTGFPERRQYSSAVRLIVFPYQRAGLHRDHRHFCERGWSSQRPDELSKHRPWTTNSV
jgi:hypothetical protein